MTSRLLFSLTVAIVVAAFWLLNCSRPQPTVSKVPPSGPEPSATGAAPSGPQSSVSVSDVKVIQPSNEGGPYRVEATLIPNGPGGTAGITFRLRNRASGEVVQMAGQVQLRPGVAVVAVAEIEAPRAD